MRLLVRSDPGGWIQCGQVPAGPWRWLVRCVAERRKLAARANGVGVGKTILVVLMCNGPGVPGSERSASYRIVLVLLTPLYGRR
jgi:hypothetical protein